MLNLIKLLVPDILIGYWICKQDQKVHFKIIYMDYGPHMFYEKANEELCMSGMKFDSRVSKIWCIHEYK